MKDNKLMHVAIAFIVIIVGGVFITQSRQQVEDQQNEIQKVGLGSDSGIGEVGNGQPNRGNCLTDDCLLVEGLEYPVGELPLEVQSALDEAINDEYKALSTYEAVISEFGMVRPFSMIRGAEEQHIASLKAIYDKYGLEAPENTWLTKITSPETLQEACQIGVDAEIANAALYKDELLPKVSGYEDIVSVFTNLMKASQEKHLPAFERCN